MYQTIYQDILESLSRCHEEIEKCADKFYATSEKLPRSLKKYISSFLGFAPADDPQVIALITIDEPVGIYYGGTIAAPVVADIFSNILPYLDITSVSETD